MVLCVFVSAPIMFLTAKIISVAKLDPSNNITALKAYQFNVSIMAIPASVSKKKNKFYFLYFMMLTFYFSVMDYFGYVKKVKKFFFQNSFLFSNFSGM